MVSVRAGLRAAVVGLAALLDVGFVASPAVAHNELVRSTPQDGAVLNSAPGTVELEFTEVVDGRFARWRSPTPPATS